MVRYIYKAGVKLFWHPWIDLVIKSQTKCQNLGISLSVAAATTEYGLLTAVENNYSIKDYAVPTFSYSFARSFFEHFSCPRSIFWYHDLVVVGDASISNLPFLLRRALLLSSR